MRIIENAKTFDSSKVFGQVPDAKAKDLVILHLAIYRNEPRFTKKTLLMYL